MFVVTTETRTTALAVVYRLCIVSPESKRCACPRGFFSNVSSQFCILCKRELFKSSDNRKGSGVSQYVRASCFPKASSSPRVTPTRSISLPLPSASQYDRTTSLASLVVSTLMRFPSRHPSGGPLSTLGIPKTLSKHYSIPKVPI